MAEPARIPSPGPEAPLTGELLTGEPVSRHPLTIRIAPKTTDPETLPVPEQMQSDPVNMSPDFDAEAADVPTGNDMIVDFGASRPPEGSSPETFSLIESLGYDADYIVSKNVEIDATAKDKPPPITETTLADPNDKAGSLFIESAKILMPLFPDRFPGDDKDPAQWGLEFMGWFNFNLPSMGMSIHKIQSAPDNQKLALLYMMELYIEKDITWDGTKRAFNAMWQDPTTYVGLGTFGFGAFLGASAKQATKAGVMSALRASLPAAKLGALEGAVFAGGQNLMEQEVKIEGGRQQEFNLGEATLAAGTGAVVAPLIVGAGAIGGAAAKQIGQDIVTAFKRSGERRLGTANIDINAPEILQTRIKAEAIPVTDKIKTPERLKLRLKIAQEYSATPARLQEKKVFIVVGPPASGKSTVADPLAERYGARIYDSDEVKALLPEFDNGVGGPAVHDESNLIMYHAMRDARRRGDNIVLPIVGKGQDKVRTILAKFQNEGYEGHIVFMDLPAEEAASRAAARFKSNGRWVDPEYVLSVKDGPAKTYEAVKGLFKSYVRYSNDVPQGSAPKLIEASE